MFKVLSKPKNAVNMAVVQQPLRRTWQIRQICFLLFTFMLLLAKQVRAQNLTLSFNNAPLEKVFKEIENQSPYSFAYAKNMVAKAKPVTLNVANASIEDVLVKCFANQPFTYKIINTVIVVNSKTPTSLNPPSTFSANGKVINEKGEVVIATIVDKTTGKAVNTNENGEFFITGLSSNSIIQVSGINIEGTEVRVNGKTSLLVTVKSKTSVLDEIQIIGYGTTTRRLATGTVSTITSAEIEKQPVSNVLQALSGRVPGLLISENSGTPGASISVQIRAVGSLFSGTSPLFIVDGVPFVSDPLYSAGGANNGSLRPTFGSSPLNALNPTDIESIDVLKDADATAIYGSRGSNGVILITTKKGKAGKTKLEANVSQGFTGVSDVHSQKPLSLKQYLEVRRASYTNSGTSPTVANAPDLLVWDTTGKNLYDFQKVLIGNTSSATDASLSFSGGDRQTNFLLSGTFHRENAVVPGDNYYNRGGVHFTIEHISLDRKFSANITSSLVWDKNNNIARINQTSDLAGYAFTLAPNFPLYDSTGKNLYWLNNSSQTFDNPLKYQYQKYTLRNNNIVGSINLRYTPIAGLNLKLNSSYNKISATSQNLIYSKGINPNVSTLPSASFQQNTVEVWNIEPQADYTRKIGMGKLNVLVGSTFQSNTFNQPYYLNGTNYTSDALLSNPQAAGAISVYTFFSEYKYQSVFGRVNYNWLNKYLLNVNYRWDASSKFGTNNRFGSFASVGGAWVFSEENFLKNKQRILSFGKIRASYGSVGNDQISNYQYLDTYSTTSYTYNGVSSLVPTIIANPDLKWEVNKKLELAVDLGFFKDRILVTGAWFRNRTGNPLVSGPISSVTGFSTYTSNLPATIQQQGTEFTFTSQNIKGKNFNWTTTFNITFADTKLLAFPGIERTNYNYSYVVGQSMSAKYGFKYTGISPTTSLPTFLDANKNGSTLYSDQYPAANGLGDYVYMGKSNPDFYGGLSNSLSYKGLQLDILFQFVGNVTKAGLAASSGYPGRTATNMSSAIYDLYKQTNGKIATQTYSLTEGTPYASFYKYLLSDAVMSNAAYIRLKNISLSYTFDTKWISRIHMASAQVFLHAQNLFTLTDFQGLDPESGAVNIPPLRTLTAGIKLSF